MHFVRDFARNLRSYAATGIITVLIFSGCVDSDTGPKYTPSPSPSALITPVPRPAYTPTPEPAITPTQTPAPTEAPTPVPVSTPTPAADLSVCQPSDAQVGGELYVAPDIGVKKRILPHLESDYSGGARQNTRLFAECQRSGDSLWYRVSDGNSEFWIPQDWTSAQQISAPPLAQNPAVIVPGGGNKIILTFDDSGDYAGPMLDVLAKYNVKGIFFPVGRWAQANPAIIQRMMDEGHLVGNHTYDHADLTKLSPDEIRNEIANGPPTNTNLLRPPYLAGCGGPGRDYVEGIASPMGWQLYCADMDTGDWRGYSAEQIISSTLEQAHPGGVPIFHMHKKSSLDALPVIIESLQAAGYELHW